MGKVIQIVDPKQNVPFAGIGSRETPADICEYMTQAATILLRGGYILRSSGAEGADTAFEKGYVNPARREIFNPKGPIVAGDDPAAREIAAKIHPAWNNLSDYVKKLHTRNVNIILGAKLNDPVKFVICWDDPAKKYGGTKFGIKLAQERNIPVFNLAIKEQLQNVSFQLFELRNIIHKETLVDLDAKIILSKYTPLKERLK